MRVLMIDDEPMLLRYYSEAPQAAGFTVTLADTNKAALAAIEREKPFDIIVEDVMRPIGHLLEEDATEFGLRSGVDCFKKYIGARHPTMQHVFLSNSSGGLADELTIRDPNCYFLSKFYMLSRELPGFLEGVVKKCLEILNEHKEDLTKGLTTPNKKNNGRQLRVCVKTNSVLSSCFGMFRCADFYIRPRKELRE